jgi:hypothetical protein
VQHALCVGTTILALERGGLPVSSSDLQAGLSGKDLGVAENVGIERIKDGPTALAMSIKLAKDAASLQATAVAHGGLSFPWEPRSMRNKVAACLAYFRVWQWRRAARYFWCRGGHGRGGDGFTAQLAWREGGHVGVTERTTKGGTTRSSVAETEDVT